MACKTENEAEMSAKSTNPEEGADLIMTEAAGVDDVQNDNDNDNYDDDGGASDDDDDDAEVAGEDDVIDDNQDVDLDDEADEEKKKNSKKILPGIVYLGHIPPRLRPKHVRNMLGVHGEIGRVFLQPEDRSLRRKKKKAGSKASSFTEGWVEYRDKRIAKRVAASLHNTPMSNHKRSRFISDLWSIKYLHRFQWCHLSERLAYEQTVFQQRLRTEISQAKRETNFYLANVEKSQNLDKLRKKRAKKGVAVEERSWDFKQRRTEEEIQRSRLDRKNMSKKSLRKAQDKAKAHQEKAQSNVSLLAKIFNRAAQD